MSDEVRKSFVSADGRFLVKMTGDSAQADFDLEAIRHLDAACKLVEGNKKILAHLNRVRELLEGAVEHELEEIKAWKDKERKNKKGGR